MNGCWSAARSVSCGPARVEYGSSEIRDLIRGRVWLRLVLSWGWKGSCARGVCGDLDRFADAQEECTGILDSPLYIRDGEMSFGDPVIGEHLHANGHGEFVIGAMQEKNPVDLYGRYSSRGDVALNPVGTKGYFGIAGALENFTMHFAVADAVAALSGGCIDYECAGHSGGWKFTFHIAVLEPEGATDGVKKIAEGEVDGGIRRREFETKSLGSCF